MAEGWKANEDREILYKGHQGLWHHREAGTVPNNPQEHQTPSFWCLPHRGGDMLIQTHRTKFGLLRIGIGRPSCIHVYSPCLTSGHQWHQVFFFFIYWFFFNFCLFFIFIFFLFFYFSNLAKTRWTPRECNVEHCSSTFFRMCPTIPWTFGL